MWLFLCLLPILALGQRSFTIDYGHETFIRDGKPFRYISGSMHYFRTHPDQWNDRLKMARAAGLNAIQTYIPWNFHETYKRKYNFSGWRNFTRFFELAQQNDLAVLVRPGPYICGEWENGGLPYWLLQFQNISLRSSEENFLRESLNWWDVLLPMLKPQLWNNGGPILMTQIENEYGSYGCDKEYLGALRDNAYKNLGNDAVLYTTDPPEVLICGRIQGVFATVDFGERGLLLGNEYWKIQNDANSGGPRVNSEYYPGWYATWGEKKPYKDFPTSQVKDLVEYLWNSNASFNIYMFHGGTNFEYWNGAEYPAGAPALVPLFHAHGLCMKQLPKISCINKLITSYDYWAPMHENGENGPKYDVIRQFISNLTDWDNTPLPVPAPAKTISMKSIPLSKYGNLFDYQNIITDPSKCVSGPAPNFENDLNLAMGFAEYSFTSNGVYSTLHGDGVKDFGYVYVNGVFKGRLSPHFSPDKVSKVNVNVRQGDNVTVLIENQGRLTWETTKDYKGLVGALVLDETPVSMVSACPCLLENLNGNIMQMATTSRTFTPGDIYVGQFVLASTGDTNVDMSNWGKGLVWINGFLLGRYWSTQGPQKSLYVPSPLLSETNSIMIMELEKLSTACVSSTLFCSVDLIDQAITF